jgi:hypothetical protein
LLWDFDAHVIGLFQSEERRDEIAVERAVSAVLQAPVGQLQGSYRGHPIEVRVLYGGQAEGGGLGVWLHVYGRLYDLPCDVVPRAGNYGPAPPHTRFDPRLAVGGAPLGVLLRWIDEGVQAACLQLGLFLHVDRDELRLLLDTKRASAPEYVQAVLELGVSLVGRLPQAIEAAGEGRYLAMGSLATHPEVGALRSMSRRPPALLIAIVVVVVVIVGWIVANELAKLP